MEFETQQVVVNPRLKMMYDEQNQAPSQGRAPASIKPSLSLQKEFLCHGLAPRLRDRISEQLVMINFKLCRDSAAFKVLELQNKTNGFRAQIFRMADGSFKTDYIQLSEGLNQLNLAVVLKDGQKIEESLEILSDLNSKQ